MVAALARAAGPGHANFSGLILDASVLLIVIVLGIVSWLVTRWKVAGGVLRIDTGLLRRSSQRYPLSQIQAIDIVQTGLARVVGLAELRLRMAGAATRGGGRLQCVRASEAEPLRSELLALAHGLSADTPPPPETVLLRVPTGRLVASVLLSWLGAITVVCVCGLVVLVLTAPGALTAALSSSAAALIALAAALYGRLNSGYRLTVALAPDGFRLRSGLVETTTETIPVGRVQAVRVVEPLLWRPLHWCRLEVEVAGKKVREENRAQGRQRRALLPVGPRSLAGVLLETLVPNAPAADRPPIARARLKAPLSYRWLAYGRNDTCVVTRSGRLRRVYHWVPLAKVQSIRRVQGPIQRALGLANVHLDTAGRSLHAVGKDRSCDEVDAEIALLPDLCRAARRAERGRPGNLRRGTGAR